MTIIRVDPEDAEQLHHYGKSQAKALKVVLEKVKAYELIEQYSKERGLRG